MAVSEMPDLLDQRILLVPTYPQIMIQISFWGRFTMPIALWPLRIKTEKNKLIRYTMVGMSIMRNCIIKGGQLLNSF